LMVFFSFQNPFVSEGGREGFDSGTWHFENELYKGIQALKKTSIEFSKE
jgi:hypothetical protein